MPELSVKNFSCIRDATISLSKITVIIGPQASGKSVLSKLIYFFVDLLEFQLTVLDDFRSLDEFSEAVKKRFVEWFPISAWGAGKFVIRFAAGDYEVKISRNMYNREINDNIRIYFSQFFKKQYLDLLGAGKSSNRSSPREKLNKELERRYQLRRISAKFLRESLGDNYFTSQLFIPAGRSFFTSLGRAILAFEHGQILDPVTIQFGRTFASTRGIDVDFGQSDVASILISKLYELIGGRVVYEGDKAYLVSNDGRKVPHSALSSGQQELLPLIVALGFVSAFSDRNDHQLLYIEEPEAHLFPLAQSRLISILAAYVQQTKGMRTTLVMTSHSPYVLAKLNTLVKAGELSVSLPKKRYSTLSEIVPSDEWLAPGCIAAYALIDGDAKNIIDVNGYVDGDYLDSVSDVISAQFSALLDLEFPVD